MNPPTTELSLIHLSIVACTEEVKETTALLTTVNSVISHVCQLPIQM